MLEYWEGDFGEAVAWRKKDEFACAAVGEPGELVRVKNVVLI